MGTMLAVASKSEKNNRATTNQRNKPQAVHEIIPESRTVFLPGKSLVIQRKCACGGSCPSCSSKDESIQPKLKLDAPDGKYKQEADRVADQVMRGPDSQIQRQSLDNQNEQLHSKSLNIPRAPLVQRQKIEDEKKEVEEEEEKTIQTKLLVEAGVPQFQLQSDFKEEIIQSKLNGVKVNTISTEEFDPVEINSELDEQPQSKIKIGGANDVYEKEADSAADKVMSNISLSDSPTKATEGMVQTKYQNEEQSQEEEEFVQTKSFKRANQHESIDEGIQSSISHGHPLHSSIRMKMEDSFGVDFSGVRIHTHVQSHKMNQGIGARAFTYGKNIYFNSGEYLSSNKSGQWLLAHELTHYIQQNSEIKRKPRITSSSRNQYSKNPPSIQRKTFGPKHGMPSGTLIHKEALPLFVKDGINPDTFIEARIPGAKKTGLSPSGWGIADFYRDKTNNRSIGVYFNDNGEPVVLKKDPDMKTSIKGYHHGNDSAPKGGFKQLSAAKPKIRRTEKAPVNIQIADLKPGAAIAEILLGSQQLGFYQNGIKDTATKVNAYLASVGNTERWNPKPKNMTSLTVPAKLSKPDSRKGFGASRLSVYDYTLGYARRRADTKLSGSMVVYETDTSGIWGYEWVPENIPTTTGSGTVDTVLNRLNTDVVGKLSGTATPKLKSNTGSTSKSQPNTLQGPEVSRNIKQGAIKPKLQTKKFNFSVWKSAYKTWKKSAQPIVSDKNEKDKALITGALVDTKKRAKGKMNLPKIVETRGKGYKKIKHWAKFGHMYGWLRNKFDGLFQRFEKFARKVKTKVQGLLKKAGGSSFGSWIKAAAKALFKVFKIVGSIAVSQVLDKLMSSLQTGITTVMQKLAASVTPEGVKSKIEEAEALKAKYEAILNEKQEALEKRLFGDHLKKFSEIAKFMAIANTITTIVSIVEWGIRIAACFSPPAIGCLWNLAITALQILFAKILETCWFTKEVFGWIKKNNIDVIMNFPTTIASFIVEKANKAIPLPDGIGPIFAPIMIDNNAFDIKCGSGGGGGGGNLTPEQIELLELIKDIGEEKFKALIEMMMKRGVGPQVQLTSARLKKLRPLLKSLTLDELKAAAEGKSKTKKIALEEFLKDISKYTSAEEKVIKDQKINYKKAAKNNKYYRKRLNWDPTKFVRSGIPEDSKEFADAILNIQRLIGITSDGILGPITTVKFYDANGVAKDKAYKKAEKMIEKQEFNRAVLIELKKPYPSNSDLAKDLNQINWSSLRNNDFGYSRVNGHTLIAIKTDAGSRIGCYYKPFKITHKGKEVYKIIGTSNYLTLNTITKIEFFTAIKKDLVTGETALYFQAVQPRAKNTTLYLNSIFVGVVLGVSIP